MSVDPSGKLGHRRETNVLEYTQRDSDSARGGIEQLPDHLSISSENAPVRLGEPVQRVLAAAPNRSQVRAVYTLFLVFYFLSLFLASRCTQKRCSQRGARSREKFGDHFAVCPLCYLSLFFSFPPLSALFFPLLREQVFPPQFRSISPVMLRPWQRLVEQRFRGQTFLPLAISLTQPCFA